MTQNKNHNQNPDLWFENQKDAIRAIRPTHKVDVTDAVMQQIASMPVPKPKLFIGQSRGVVRWAAAACVAAVVGSAALFVRPNAAAANVSSSEIAASLFDVYGYCNDFVDADEEDEVYYDNPVANFF